jgi:hypothetical protein
LFGLNIFMEIKSEKDFDELRQYMNTLSRRFPMFRHDVAQIEKITEEHIKNHSIALVYYRQTRRKIHLENAQKEIDGINRVLSIVGKLELMAILSQG